MKKMIFFLVLLFPVNLFAQESEVKQNYVKSKDITSYAITVGKFAIKDGSAAWMIQAEHTGGKAVNPRVYLMLITVGDSWRYTKTNLTLRAIGDSRKIVLGKMVRIEPGVFGRSFSETLSLVISPRQLETLSNYSTLDVQVGSDKFSFETVNLENIKRISTKLQSVMPVKTTASKPLKRRN